MGVQFDEYSLVRRGLYYEGCVQGDKLEEVLALHGRKSCTTYGTRTSVRSSRSRSVCKQPVAVESDSIKSTSSDAAVKENDNPSDSGAKVFINNILRYDH